MGSSQVRLLRRSGTSLLVGSAAFGGRRREQEDEEEATESPAQVESLACFALELVEVRIAFLGTFGGRRRVLLGEQCIAHLGQAMRAWAHERWDEETTCSLGIGLRIGMGAGHTSSGIVGA
jgi:hypothetical protein